MAADFVEAGVPIAGRLEAPALAEGGDTIWLDERTLLVGRGYRTNDAGIEALRELLPDVEVIVFDLPHYHGPGEVMHLMSFLSPLDVDLAVVYPPLMPVRLVEILQERGIELVEVPDEEFESMGPNVLALGPRVAARARRQRRDAPAHGARRRRRPRLPGRAHLPPGRRRPDLPHAPAPARRLAGRPACPTARPRCQARAVSRAAACGRPRRGQGPSNAPRQAPPEGPCHRCQALGRGRRGRVL